VVIAASTGGPKALSEVVAHMPEGFNAAVLVVQHMPEEFLHSLARRLSQLGPLPVDVARHGEPVLCGRFYLAPGNRHRSVVRDRGQVVVKPDDGPALCGVRPSADPLFISAA